MKNKILITAATEREMSSINTSAFESGYSIARLISGIGSASTVYTMMKYLARNDYPDYIINIGIAGSFDPDLKIGDTVIVECDCFADLGMEDKKGFISLWDSGLVEPSAFPLENGWIYSDRGILKKLSGHIRKARGVTVNKASGTIDTITRLKESYKPDIETMEVAAALYVGRLENVPVLAMRSVSNMIEPRNTDAWDINKGLASLQAEFEIILQKLQSE
jgi:futalosine hydrolase